MPSLDLQIDGSELPRVLLADDDSATRRLLSALLAQWGFEVVVATNGDEAWDILHQVQTPKIVLVDWSMPGMDGIELCRKLRATPREYYPYILMLTGKSDNQDIVKALESGADDYLAKPFDAAALKARLTVARRMLKLQDGLIEAREELRMQATKDALTGLFNRAAFLDLFERELNRALRLRSHTGLLLLDLDHFKKINDTYGHSIGDNILREFARRLKQTVRTYDFVGRYGGEEFCVVIPNCPERIVRERAEAIRMAIVNDPIRIGELSIPVTVSVGATVVFADTSSCSDVIAVADVALYRAKSAGRNRTVCCRQRLAHKPRSNAPIKAQCAECAAKYAQKCVVKATTHTVRPALSDRQIEKLIHPRLTRLT